MISEESKVAFSTTGFFQRWTGGNFGILIRSICSGLLGGWLCAVAFLFTKTEFTIFSDDIIVIPISIFYFLAIMAMPISITGLLVHSVLVIVRVASWLSYVIAGAVTGFIAMIALNQIVDLEVGMLVFQGIYTAKVCGVAGGFCALSFWLSLRPDCGPKAPKHRIYVTHRSRDIGG